MFIRLLNVFSVVSFFVLVACQTMGPNAGVECMAGFVKTKSGVCRSLKNLTNEEVYEANAHFDNQAPLTEEQIATRRETQRMMESMKAAESASRYQMALQQSQYQQQQMAAPTADRNQAPVKFLDGETTAVSRRNGTVDRAAFRAELKPAFANETRASNGANARGTN